MIYGEGFNIIHMPKTGGTWLRRACERLPRGSKIVRDIDPLHRPAQVLSQERARLPTYVLVRSPWDWYVSLYGHWHGNVSKSRHEFRHPYKQLTPYWRGVHDRFKGDFRSAMLPFLRGAAPADPHTGKPSESMSDVFSKLTSRPGLDLRVRKYEDGPRNILRDIIREHCPKEYTQDVERLLTTHQQENVSQRRRDYKTYYTPELQELVSRLDAELIEEHGYRFGA